MENALMRLSPKERDDLKLLVSALKVCEYTDEVDGARGYEREEKIHAAAADLLGIITGMSFVARDLSSERKREIEANPGVMKVCTPLYASLFEVGRRFKHLNPDKMRSEYGKLVMLLQDLRTSRLQSRLGLTKDLVQPLLTVAQVLRSIQCEELLKDPRLVAAATPLSVKQLKDGASEKRKEQLRQELITQYGEDNEAKREIIERCICSVDDDECLRRLCVTPVQKMKFYLHANFGAASQKPKFSLEIRAGRGGSCLSHSHTQQFHFVLESLTLWEIIQRDILLFWDAVESDMIGETAGSYSFCNTGQGMHRVSAAPKTGNLMRRALSEARGVMNDWVGSTIVHLGDRDVPNALVFIDKYTVIPRLLGPIAHTIEELSSLGSGREQHPGIQNFLKAKYGSVEDLKMIILQDFFCHGFDGSGDDGGSCIDGRLTSAWNWCSLLHKKSFYDAFLLTGFAGFDGLS